MAEPRTRWTLPGRVHAASGEWRTHLDADLSFAKLSDRAKALRLPMGPRACAHGWWLYSGPRCRMPISWHSAEAAAADLAAGAGAAAGAAAGASPALRVTLAFGAAAFEDDALCCVPVIEAGAIVEASFAERGRSRASTWRLSGDALPRRATHGQSAAPASSLLALVGLGRPASLRWRALPSVLP